MYIIEAINHANVIPTTTTHMTYRFDCCMRLYRMYIRNLRVAMCINSPEGLYDNFKRVWRYNAFMDIRIGLDTILL
jgi:hypothetical protein